MPVGKFEKDCALSDAVIIEGAFFSSFLSAMSGDIVKVYLYLLYLCRHPESKLDQPSAIAAAVGITEQNFIGAMNELAEKQLLSYTPRPFTFELRSVSAAARQEGAYAPGALTAYRDYFAGLRALLPARSIKPVEYDKARDWVELYGLSVEAALLLVSHCVEMKDASISFNFMDTVALSWANDGITTTIAAEEYLSLYQAKHHDAAKVLLHLGMKRTPSVDEMRLFNRWSEELGFDLQAVLAACAETTKAHSPSFGYVDGILRSLHALGLHDARSIKAYLAENGDDRRLVSSLLFELGEKTRSFGSTEIETVKALVSAGFRPETLIAAAKYSAQGGSHSFRKFSERMNLLKEKKDFSAEGIRVLLENQSKPEQKKNSFQNFAGRGENGQATLFTDPDSLEDV